MATESLKYPEPLFIKLVPDPNLNARIRNKKGVSGDREGKKYPDPVFWKVLSGSGLFLGFCSDSQAGLAEDKKYYSVDIDYQISGSSFLEGPIRIRFSGRSNPDPVYS